MCSHSFVSSLRDALFEKSSELSLVQKGGDFYDYSKAGNQPNANENTRDEYADFTDAYDEDSSLQNLAEEEQDLADPDVAFEKVTALLPSLCKLISTNMLLTNSEATTAKGSSQIYDKYLQESLARLVFGSNNIENSGLDYESSIRISKENFASNSPKEVTLTHDERISNLSHLARRINHQHTGELFDNIDIAGRETKQHTLALKHFFTKFILEDEGLSEKLLLDTHKILMHGLASADGTPSEEYAGIYRKDPVTAGDHAFPPPALVPILITPMLEYFNADMLRVEQTKEIDPFNLAAKYSHIFVNIHPFEDGNGRMCRLILNAILLKYVGIVVPWGMGDQQVEEWMVMARNGSMAQVKWEEDEELGKVPWSELATSTVVLVEEYLKVLKEKLNGGEDEKL